MLFNSTVLGASHRDIGKECQDYSLTWSNRSGSIRIAVVSDGHGGEQYYNSAFGSQLACKVTADVLKEVAASVRRIRPAKAPAILKTVCCSIVARWNDVVDKLKGADSVRSFGCTLIACLQTPKYWFGLQIGDGKFVVLDSSAGWQQPVPWDDRCILNYTTSLCDDSALEEFRCAVGIKAPDAIFLSSDGIDSTFEDGELLYNFYEQILKTACSDGREKICSELPGVLTHFSEVGSRDDMSIAVIINRKNKI